MKNIGLLLVLLSIMNCGEQETKKEEIVEIIESTITTETEVVKTLETEKTRRYTPLALNQESVNDSLNQYRANNIAIDINQNYEQQDQNYLELSYDKKIIDRYIFSHFFDGVEQKLTLFYSTLDDNYILVLDRMYEYSSAYYVFKIDNKSLVLVSEFEMEVASDVFYDYQYKIIEENGSLNLKIYDKNNADFSRIEKLLDN